jgi:hypothetical protein
VPRAPCQTASEQMHDRLSCLVLSGIVLSWTLIFRGLMVTLSCIPLFVLTTALPPLWHLQG